MSDIVERLREADEYKEVFDHLNRPYGLAKSIDHEAADEIEKLRAALNAKGCSRGQTTTQYCAEVIDRDAEIEKLRAALRDIARQPEGDEQSAQAVARAALGEKE